MTHAPPAPPPAPPSRAGAASRRTKDDIVRVELVRADGVSWQYITSRELQLSSYERKTGPEAGREECFLKLNKVQCTELGFGHYFDGKAASTLQLKLNVQVGATGALGSEVLLSPHSHGTSRKVGWVGAALRLVLVRAASLESSAAEGAEEENDGGAQ
jgi:hypothetical protein